MFGFKKKEKNLSEQPKKELNISTIPADFYGGANPVIKFRDVEKEVLVQHPREKETGLTKKEKEIFDKQTAKGSGKVWHPANFLTNRRFLILGSLAIFLFFVLGASVYYWSLSRKTKQVVAKKPIISNIITTSTSATATSTATTSVAVATSTSATTSTTSTTKLALGETAVEFPSTLLGYGADLDGDKLSDEEEKIFGADPGIVDTDGDGYSDGHEIYYLYNPNGQEPKLLIDSAKVKEYSNPTFGYKLYYPASWAVGSVDKDYREILFSDISGENIEVRVFDLSNGVSFTDWFGKWAKQEKYGELQDFTGVFSQLGKKRSDDLVYYFTDSKQKRVYLIVYHVPLGSMAVNFREMIILMARSLRLTDNTFVKPWPVEINATTSTKIVTSTVTTSTKATSTKK